jgi:hypothetical protein
MAVTATLVTSGGLPYRVVGAEKETLTEVTGDNSYELGGETLTAAQLGLNVVNRAQVTVIAGSESETNPVDNAWYTTSNSKIHFENGKTSKEIAETTDMSKVKCVVMARGV